jgi:hypothetical protein
LPTASIDFAFATIAMIVIVMGTISGLNMAVEPYLGTGDQEDERYYQIGRHMLLSEGEPAGWGAGSTPTDLGFASAADAYQLDIDKVTRLNPSNAYALDYSSLWQALGVDDVSFHIGVDTLFDVSLSLASTQVQGSDTVYNFSASTSKDGYPIPTQLSYYISIADSTLSNSRSTDDDGYGSVVFTLPNSLNGTGLLVGLAEAEESIVGYGVLSFAHNIGSPNAPGAYATLSPLDHVLHVDFSPGASAVNAAVYTLDYAFDLVADGSDYAIPHLLDWSPMVLVLTGVEGSVYWAEWVAYPQVPLEVGADMDADYVVSDVAHATYVVEVKGALYRFDIDFRSPTEDD